MRVLTSRGLYIALRSVAFGADFGAQAACHSEGSRTECFKKTCKKIKKKVLHQESKKSPLS